MKKRIIAIIALSFLVAVNMEKFMAHAQTQTPTSAQVLAQTSSSTLPNGASSLNESYQDWVVLCSASDKGRLCVMTQQQRRQDTDQLVLAMELSSISANEIKGTLVLPFGLRLADGVTLQIDDGAVSKPLAFTTCLPAGCIVPLSLDAAMVKALRAGTVLRLVTKAHDTGQNVGLSVSLKGFAAAQDRAVTLAKA
ncbi:invasion associated locus B family protein [Rhizobium terrae]|uniref:invasion associated locus B family protein n=1 Tax=Rhizobium terrae TaxID=2171756 RepID=UPI0013C2F7C6|nr:invasion associated locus B family protein [Rhizobium terrae]